MTTCASGSATLSVVVNGTTVTLDFARWPAASRSASRRFLLIHGSPGHLDHFAPLVRGLSLLGEVVAVDLPGYGRRRDTRAPSLDWHADVAAAFARRVWPAEPIDLVGQSFGGGVVLTMLV